MELEGKVERVMPVTTGSTARGSWSRQELIVETGGDYPKKVCVSFWGDKAAPLATLKPGEMVKVSFDPESREYNGRWYTDLRAWKIERSAAAPDVPLPAATDEPFDQSAGFDDMPF